MKRDKVDWLVACKVKARRTIEAQWREKDIQPYQMDEVQVGPTVTTFEILPSLQDNVSGINLFVDLSGFDLTPQSRHPVLTTVFEEEEDEDETYEDEEDSADSEDEDHVDEELF